MKIGDIVTINNKLYRKCGKVTYTGQDKYWATQSINETKAIYLGKRVLSNGYKQWCGDDGWVYTHQESVDVALVKTFDNTNPFYTILKETKGIQNVK